MQQPTYHSVMRKAEAALGIKALMPEYEVLSTLFDGDAMTPLDMSRFFSGSHTSFYKVLRDLEAKGVVEAIPNPADKRSKLYRLTEMVFARLGPQWERYDREGWEIYQANDPREAIRTYTDTIRSNLKIKQFTCEFQILLYLNANPGMMNIAFHDLVDVSESKFNLSLVKLVREGLIYFEFGPDDRRRKLYFLTEKSAPVLKQLEVDMFAWLDSMAIIVRQLLGRRS